MSSHPPLKVANGLLSGTGTASWFGTKADTGDNGIGSTGFNSRERPLAAYLSLPREYWDKFKLVDYQLFTVVYRSLGGQERHVKPVMLVDVGPGDSAHPTSRANYRMVNLGPVVAMRLTLTDSPDDITDKIVSIFSRQNSDGTWPAAAVEERF